MRAKVRRSEMTNIDLHDYLSRYHVIPSYDDIKVFMEHSNNDEEGLDDITSEHQPLGEDRMYSYMPPLPERGELIEIFHR